MLPTLVALHQLGFEEELAAFINTDRDKWCTITKQYPGFSLSLRNHFPDLIRTLNLPPDHWSHLRGMRHQAFRQAQVTLAQTRLWDNKIDHLNAPWLVNPDAE